jgi:hypothetical protein
MEKTVMPYSPGQMTWRPYGATEPALHLRLSPLDPWKSYKEFPQFMQPDPPHFSEGYATFIALLKQNWQSV